MHDHLAAAVGEGQVTAAGGNQHLAGADPVTLFGLTNRERAGGVQTVCERTGEAGGDVLNNHDTGGEIGRKRRNQCLQRRGAARRGPDHHHVGATGLQ